MDLMYSYLKKVNFKTKKKRHIWCENQFFKYDNLSFTFRLPCSCCNSHAPPPEWEQTCRVYVLWHQPAVLYSTAA